MGDGGGDDVQLMPDETPSLLDGRSFDVTVYEDGTRSARLPVTIGGDDPLLDEMLAHLEGVCTREAHLVERFESTAIELGRNYLTPRNDNCSVEGARQQQLLLCIGHRLLGMSESVMPMDFIDDGTGQIALRTRRLVEEVPEAAPSALLTIPVQDNESRATLAMWAMLAFQRAALLGAHLTDPATCADRTLAVTLPPYEPDGSRVPLAFVVASATAEAMHQMMDAADRGKDQVRAAAASDRARDTDRARSATRFFRGSRNSLLGAASLYLRAPSRLFDPGALQFGEEEGEDGEFATCALAPEGESDEVAMMLVEGLAVDPRATAEEREGGVLEQRVRDALVASQPMLFDELAGASDEEFFEHVGTSVGAVRQAAMRAETRARVLGRVIVDDGVVDGVPRVRGTTPQNGPAPAAFQFARIAGAARIHQEEGAGFRPASSYGAFDLASLPAASGSNAYGQGPALETLDVVATALALAASRSDMSRVTEPSGETLEFAEATQVASAARVFSRERVPLRAQICVGNATAGGVDRARVRLFGADADSPKRYEIWVGEAGLQCATTGEVEGEPCADSDYRIDPATSIAKTGATHSGFGSGFVEADFAPADLPGAASAIAATRLYVTEQIPSGTRRAVLGFMPEPMAGGSGDPTWNRCAILPAGEQAMESTDVVDTDGEDCTQAATDCAGVPFDQRIPLEDEIAEAVAGIGGDNLETSFAHYLSMARQAADEADMLGQQLVQHGLELDLRAEAAAEEVQRVCGITIPVLHLPGASGCPNGQSDCDSLPGNHEHPDGGYSCVLGTCQPNSVYTYLQPGPDLERVEGCLGTDDEGSVVNLGQEEVCVWRVNGGTPCATGGLSDLEGYNCPWPKNAAGECELDPPVTPPSGTTIAVEPTQALGLVSGQGPAALGDGACNGISTVVRRHGMAPHEVLDNLSSATWLRHGRFDQVASALRWRDEPLWFSSIGGATNAWASLGSMLAGPNDSWPCAPMDGVDMNLCAGDLSPEERPLACGFHCDSAAGRRHAAERLMSAQAVLQRLVGRTFGYTTMLYQREADIQDVITSTILGDIADYPSLADDSVCFMAPYPYSTGTCLDELKARATFLVSFTTAPKQMSDYSLWMPLESNLPDPGPVAPWEIDDLDMHYAFNSLVVPYVRTETDLSNEHSRLIRDPPPPINSIWLGPGSFIDNFILSYGLGAIRPTDGVSTSDFVRADAAAWLIGVEGTQYPYYYFPSADAKAFRSFPDPGLDNYEIAHALELGCLAINAGTAAIQCDQIGALESVNSIDGLERLAAQVQCASRAFEMGASQIVFSDIPESLVDEISQGSVSSTYPASGGQYGSTIASLQAELRTIPTSIEAIAAAERDVGAALAIAAAHVRTDDLHDEYATLSQAHSAIGHATQCIVAVASAASIDIAASVGGGIAAGATCVGGLVQTILEMEMSGIEDQIRAAQLKIHLVEAAQAIALASDRLYLAAESFNQGIGRINALLAELDSLRSQGRTGMSKALVTSVDAVSGQEYPVNDVMRARLSTDRIRYERAHRNAVRLAWLARRAIEQRLGVDLDDLTEPMTLVDAPSEWAPSVCEMGGINYAEIRGELEGPIADYADEFVGDYVRQLELFLQSYRIDHPFENGSDVAVVSVRDELLNVREACDAESYNLFTQSVDPTTTPWAASCNSPAERCPVVSLAQGGPFRTRTDAMGNAWARPYGPADAFKLGTGCPEEAVDQTVNPWMCNSAVPNGGSLSQTFTLPAGTYLVSWYEQLATSVFDCDASCATTCGTDAACLGPCLDTCVDAQCATTAPPAGTTPRISLVVAADATLPAMDQASATVPELLAPADPWLDSCNWRRAMARITVPVEQSVIVGFRVDADPMEMTELLVERAWAAPQLEALAPHEAALASIPPRTYFPSDGDGSMPFGLCPDDDGSTFRSELHWERRCEYLCADGFRESCGDESSPTAPSDRNLVRCFRETRFRIGQDAIERGELLSSSGFALGNYNYRHARIAVNLVGTEVRDCTTAENPSACYANAYVPISIYHDGPFTVRNHWGEDYEAPLFPGRIEHAKGLTAERYLTNPISGADRGMLTDYWRTEFRGRTLPGEYRLRVYDTPGLQWESVEDVQLILDYQYWTRFE